ncbi:hypothetical protein COW36_19440 [bacterium (Candidatus Blackallbacteria) CG17_big_fil_post_rev_8_21_14_2_50_48_46]|uniref:Uncharacterized protein n=1 Tax=bacterium (Candidatus Blackallbacteria) CG17_big_fil_post_rev_8_21_14_2_50_48_46 TaxID=2014261 RepID=A0A2M7G0D1_9BACT|nr:MAG: hypothetical protein COW64_25030 [bacterium (Candidatus Blackallbacteria) CG18_big_fil_WC_8_21_14_2_50_49_26]PIW15097.1 MAG: hypothetical protein COW36_19440 [bacterium (Candidatus Blackallbacteria) CG17_big_fil_post_rev_8_21_14_2_50_48_46]PIW47580.1 MAG: hypothetical protein COW20_11880 [bacterium (Candidatus Blackallbacteria) CG13_big_fil_rev_8_21_14_2_50_49_14]
MIDFKSLAAVKTQLKNPTEQRQQESRKHYQFALDFLEKYRQNLEQETLKKAIQELVTTLKYDKNQAEPYLLLSYLYFALEQPQLAVKYLKKGQELSPHSTFAQDLQFFLDKGKPLPYLPKKKPEPLTYDPEVLYSQMEWLLQQIKSQMTEYAIVADLEKLETQLAKLETAIPSWLSACHLIQQKLEQLDRHFDINPFFEDTQAIEAYYIQLSQSEIQLRSGLKIHQQIGNIFNEISTNKAHLEDLDLEHLLDRCDLIADQLDDLDSHNELYRLLEAKYHQMIQCVEESQDLLNA